MALNIAALRARLARANNGGKAQDFLFKPEEGLNTIRIVPLQGSDDPFQELLFHFGLGGKTYLSPRSFGGRDPIAEFSDSLVAKGGLSKEEYKEAKKLSPQKRTYLPVVVRGKESEGVKFWAFGATVMKQITEIMLMEEDYGDITDPKTGHDIRVNFTPQEKSDTNFAKTTIMAVPRPSVLTADEALLDRLLNQQPVLKECVGKVPTYEELSSVLQALLNPTEAGDITEPPVETVAETTVKAGGKTKKVPVDVSAAFDEAFNSL
jgi:hypothetical protein